MQISTRPALEEDLEWLVALRIETMTNYLVASGETLSHADQLARVVQDFDCIEVVENHDDRIGMMKVVRGDQQWQLVQIQCLPPFQSKGIGTLLIGRLIAEAEAEDVPLTLSVLKVNPAKHLYDRLGFKVTKEKATSYEMRIDPQFDR